MIPGSKVLFHGKLACQWKKDFMTRPNMSKKWGRGPADCEYWAGLWERVARNNPVESFCTVIMYERLKKSVPSYIIEKQERICIMKKTKRILALIGAIALIGLYVVTLVLALLGSSHTFDLLMTSIIFSAVIPIMIWVYERLWIWFKKSKEGRSEQGKIE